MSVRSVLVDGAAHLRGAAARPCHTDPRRDNRGDQGLGRAQGRTEHQVDAIVLATRCQANDYMADRGSRAQRSACRGNVGQGRRPRLSGDHAARASRTSSCSTGPNTNANVGFASIHLEGLVTRFALQFIDALVTRD